MRPALGGWDGKGHFRHTKCPSENTSPVCSLIFKSRWEMKCFALRLCSVLKDLLGLEQVFILNYGDPIHSAQGCLLNSILRRALIRNIQGRAWVQREGEGWRKDPGDIQGGSAAAPQADWSASSPALPTPFPTHPFPWCLHTYIYIVVWVMGQSIPFSFSIIPETSSCYSWHFSSWEHSEMWLLAQKKKKSEF